MTQDKRKSIKKQKLRFLRHQLYWLCWTWQDNKGLFSSEANFELMIRISMLDSTIFNEDAEVAEWPTVDEIEGVVHPERDRLEVLTVLVDDYQARRHPISSPDPIAAIEFVLEQQGLSRKDLEDAIDSSGRI